MQRRAERTMNGRRKEPKMMKYQPGGPVLKTIPKGTLGAFGAGLAGMVGQAISKGVKKRKAVNEIMDDTGKSRRSARQQYNKEIEQGSRPTMKTGGVACAKCGGSMPKYSNNPRTIQGRSLRTGGELAAMYGDPNKITRGDIITAAKRNKRKK